jgi:hypothetical protein
LRRTAIEIRGQPVFETFEKFDILGTDVRVDARQMHHQVAGSTRALAGVAVARQPVFAWLLRPGRQFEAGTASQRRHLDAPAGKPPEDAYGHLAMEVTTLQDEQRMRSEADLEIQVAGNGLLATGWPGCLPGQPQALAVEQPGRHGDRQRAQRLLPAAARAVRTGGLAQVSAPGTDIAATGPAARARHPTTTATGWAGHQMIVLHPSAASTVVAGTQSISSTFLWQPDAASSSVSIRACTRVIADVPGNRVAGGRLGRQRLPPHGQALWIAQQLIGRVHPLEFAAGDRRRVAIRVPEHGQPPVGALDFLARRLLLYAKDRERIVSEGHWTVTGRRTAALLRISRILPILQCYPYTQLATKSSRQSSDPHASTCKTMTILTFVMPVCSASCHPAPAPACRAEQRFHGVLRCCWQPPAAGALARTLDLISRTLAARALSLIGHPALLVPAAVVQGASIRQAPVQVLLVATAVSLLVALDYPRLQPGTQVRTGCWTHVDASLPRERTQLNLFAAPLLFAAAAVLWWLGQPPAIALGLALGGALVVFAHLLRRWLKLSLHAGFAAFSALLLWPSYLGMLSLLLLAVGVAWSRLVLSRHTPQDVALGLLAGATAGLAFNFLAG